jgi:hypothetical protein
MAILFQVMAVESLVNYFTDLKRRSAGELIALSSMNRLTMLPDALESQYFFQQAFAIWKEVLDYSDNARLPIDMEIAAAYALYCGSQSEDYTGMAPVLTDLGNLYRAQGLRFEAGEAFLRSAIYYMLDFISTSQHPDGKVTDPRKLYEGLNSSRVSLLVLRLAWDCHGLNQVFAHVKDEIAELLEINSAAIAAAKSELPK